MVSQRIMRDRRGKSEVISNPESLNPFSDRWVTPGGIPVFFRAEPLVAGRSTALPRDLWLHQEHCAAEPAARIR